MSLFELKEFLEKMKVQAEFHQFEEHTMTVDAAVKRLGVKPERIIKSMLYLDDARLPIMAIVPGNRKVSETKLAKVCSASRVFRATPEQVKEHTGYVVGAVPPIGHRGAIRTFIDEKSMPFQSVIGGGGEVNTLLEISPKDVQRLTNAIITDISK